ncbi:hypothetical protein CF642_37885, partial [Burkholderia pseudomallei]
MVGSALPTIVAELRGFDLYACVATSYLLASVITVPIFVRLADYSWRKPFVCGSRVGFPGASLLCAVAHVSLSTALARVLHGVAGAVPVCCDSA